MGRPLRIDGDGLFHHVIIKGINDLHIFKESVAKQHYIEILFKNTEKHDLTISAYCIMDNHAHLLLLSGKSKGLDKAGNKRLCLSDYMHDVQTSYSKWYNKRHKRKGPLYNNRFKSFTCYSKPYFINVLAYVLYNPIKHGKTKTLDYRYSSYSELTTKNSMCNLDALCDYLNMSMDDIIKEVHMRANRVQYPILNEVVKHIQSCTSLEQATLIIENFQFVFSELCGYMSDAYFKLAQKKIVVALTSIGLIDSRIASWLNISKAYVKSCYHHP